MDIASPRGPTDAAIALPPRRVGRPSSLSGLPAEIRRELCRRIRGGDLDGDVANWLGDAGYPTSRWAVRRFRKAIEPALLRIEEARAVIGLWAEDDRDAESGSAAPQDLDIAAATVAMLRAAAFAGAARIDATASEGVRDLERLSRAVQRFEAADRKLAVRRRDAAIARGAAGKGFTAAVLAAIQGGPEPAPDGRNPPSLCETVRNCAG